MSESIQEELIAENQFMRDKLSKLLSKSTESCNPFIVLSGEPLMLTGVAISKGVWKGTLYDSDEIQKMVEKLKFLLYGFVIIVIIL